MTKVTTNQIIDLINSLPESDMHIYEDDGQFTVTSEWLVGSFAGRGFDANTLNEAVEQLIDYLYEHINHQSIVGRVVTNSGFPNMDNVASYCKNLHKNDTE